MERRISLSLEAPPDLSALLLNDEQEQDRQEQEDKEKEKAARRVRSKEKVGRFFAVEVNNVIQSEILDLVVHA